MSGTQTEYQYADCRPPSGSFFPTSGLRLAGTGTTEAATTAALTKSEMATLLVGAVAIRFKHSGSAQSAGAVATTDPILGAYTRYDWMVQDEADDFVAIEAADGTSAYEAWVWTSSGVRSFSVIGVLAGALRAAASTHADLSAATIGELAAGVSAAATVTGALTDAA